VRTEIGTVQALQSISPHAVQEKTGATTNELETTLSKDLDMMNLTWDGWLVGWRFCVAVTRRSRSTQLLYIEPG